MSSSKRRSDGAQDDDGDVDLEQINRGAAIESRWYIIHSENTIP